MYIKENTAIGPVVVIVHASTKERLSTTCFRGSPINRAGNFSDWASVYDVFSNSFVLQSLFADIIEAHGKSSKANSVSIRLPENIGWSGTDELKNYSRDKLEIFNPNKKTKALRVKKELVDLTAPLTDNLTVVYVLKMKGGLLTAVVYSLYPGKDIGELRGNISAREQCVFFDWEHPGCQDVVD